VNQAAGITLPVKDLETLQFANRTPLPAKAVLPSPRNALGARKTLAGEIAKISLFPAPPR